MGKLRGSTLLILVLCMLFISLFAVGDEGQHQHGMENQEKRQSVSEMLRSMFSTTSSTSTSYWEKFTTLVNQAHTYLCPPNLDFRCSDEAEVNDGGGGAGEKVKETVAKSLGKSKATLEDSAKSAAKIAGETAEKTAEKVKKSLTKRGAESEGEL